MSPIRPDYFKTDHGQFLSGAISYIDSALVIIDSDDCDTDCRRYQRPVLNLLAQGIELLLKFPHLAEKRDLEEVRKFGPDLIGLWNSPESAALRALTRREAQAAWRLASSSLAYPDDDFSKNPLDQLDRALRQLNDLYTRKYVFPLRYLLPRPLSAPKPRFLIEVFGNTARRLLDDPSLALR